MNSSKYFEVMPGLAASAFGVALSAPYFWLGDVSLSALPGAALAAGGAVALLGSIEQSATASECEIGQIAEASRDHVETTRAIAGAM